MKPYKAWIMIVLGSFFTLLGGSFIFMYIMEAIINRIGEADQSLVFWYLPVLFLGLIAVSGGITLLWSGIKHKRNP